MREEDVRARLVEALEADLVGPFLAASSGANAEELLPLPPSRWYLTGFLAPKGGEQPEADDTDSVDEMLGAGSDTQAEDAGQEEAAQKRPLRFPASLGLSAFLPPGDGDSVDVDVWFADYAKIEVAVDRTDRVKPAWKRVPHGPVRMSVPLDALRLATGPALRVPNSGGLRLHAELRETDMDGLAKHTRVLSLFLVNERPPSETDPDSAFAFQVKLALHHSGGFVARPNRRGEASDDDDQRVLALTFRDQVEWAVGHNTSLKTPIVRDERVTTLETTQLPTYEVPRVDHRSFADVETRMADLAKADGAALRNALTPLVDAYADWIKDQARISLDRKAFEATRDELVDKANRAKARIAEGIELLATDEQVRKAFSYANRAMHQAAVQMDDARADKRYKDGKKPAWRPFQLAFVLMNLASVTNAKHADRTLAELIYFPTGGGKTEAYLGLIAFTLVLRRMRSRGTAHEGRGVAVLLRYTLRLLTLDQLSRAATLVCALEGLRHKNPNDLGNARFTIGLWVGASATANKLSNLHEQLSDHTSRESPFPLATCPWCFEQIKVQNIKLVDAAGKPTKKNFVRACVYCDGPKCAFTEAQMPGVGLPVIFVDEQIYREVPSFVVATVDKFAMLPWIGDAGALFGRVTHADDQRAYTALDDPPSAAKVMPEGFLPPELIVQDELHLISGPLGTMVGLFEAAVEYLCEHPVSGEARPPKIICSTATVRRAREQILALFGRPMALFPPRGVNDGDNFFSRVLTGEPGRLYVGVAAPGRALRAVSVRSYATLLAAANKHFDPKGDPQQPADPYMTLVGYFNSLRELGGMRRLVEDEVRNRVRKIGEDKRPLDFMDPHPWAASRKLDDPAELTSRASTEEVKRTKNRLATRRIAKAGEPEPLDVVLASNMISVGLDIDRLGLMVVTGQPKTSAEYIQATSRVGRTYPGLVVTCLNTSRPRDRSHYERFVSYHASFYREVEATSVTPFSGQALDRGLHATIVAMVRHAIREMQPPLGFMKIHEHRPEANRILAWLVTRAREHRMFHDDEAERRISNQIEKRGKSFLDAWEQVVTSAGNGAGKRSYGRFDKATADSRTVLFTAIDDIPSDLDERKFQLPMSMRDVEPNTQLWVRFKQLDERS